MVFPKESEWFWELQENGEVRKLEETEFFKNDLIGLKKLMDSGKVQFVEFQGQHLEITDEEVDNIIVPFLQS